MKYPMLGMKLQMKDNNPQSRAPGTCRMTRTSQLNIPWAIPRTVVATI